MKDALGHGSDPGTHAAGITALPTKTDVRSDEVYHAQMPLENYGSMIQDLLGMWKGTQEPDPLSVGEIKQVHAAYNNRADWRVLARTIQDQRKGTPS